MDRFDDFLRKQITEDTPNLETNPATFEQLRYQALIKNASQVERQNALLPSLVSILSSKFLAWKLSAAALLFISFFGYQQMNNQSNFIHCSDTAQIINIVDTLNLKTYSDTIVN